MELRVFNVQFLEAADAKRILDELLQFNNDMMSKDEGWKLLDGLNQVTAMRMIGYITIEETHTVYPEEQWQSIEEFIKTINAKKKQLKNAITT
jgi:hypothetical protein